MLFFGATQNSANGSFLDVCCSVESETLSREAVSSVRTDEAIGLTGALNGIALTHDFFNI